MIAHSAIYKGEVYHRRLRPKKHFLRYRMFYMLLDLNELDALDAKNRFFSRNRFNVFSFFDKDHGIKDGNLLAYIGDALSQAGCENLNGRIELLTMPRVMGYAFNPLSIYFCYDDSDTLRAILYEVTSTFGKRRTYVLEVASGQANTRIRQACAKELYVSPFMDMGMDYRFDIAPPSETLSVGVNGMDQEGLLIATAFNGRKLPLDDKTLLGLALSIPFQSFKVIGAIHWEALKLWVKGIRLTQRPAEDDHALSAPAKPERYDNRRT